MRALPNYSGYEPHINELKAFGEGQSEKLSLFGHIAGWVVLAGVALAVVTAGYQYRVEVVRIWPKAATLYALLGESIDTRGLTIQTTSYQLEYEGDILVLAVTGEVVNTSDTFRPVPRIRVSLRDAARQKIFDWTFDSPVKQLAPDGKGAFVTRLGSLPESTRELRIAFVLAT